MKLSSILSSLFVSGLVALTKAEKYNVVALPSEYGGSTVGLVVDNGTPVTMNSSVNGMYWSVDADKASSEYYFVILNEGTVVYSEKANLNFSRLGSASLNQVFGRRYVRAGKLLKTIPRIYPARKGYTEFSKLFQEGEIPVISVHLNDQDFNTLKADSGSDRETKYIASMDIFTPDEIFQFTNVEFSLGGMGSRGYKKHPFNIKLSDNAGDSKSNTEIFDRSNFKLRNLVFDSSYIKNKMAVDIMTSLGLPVAQSAHARLYVNDTPFGLYELSDSPSKKKFVRNMFHAGQKKKEVKYGTLYKGCSLSSDVKVPAFLYNDYPEYTEELYKTTKVAREGAQALDDINEVLAWFDSLTDSTPESEIRQKFDVDVFLKAMAVEYLTCQWDGYLQGGNNYYVYRNSDGFITVFPFDFDLTFGKWCEFIQTPFDTFAQSAKDYGTKGKISAQLYHKILNREPFKSQMKTILDETVSRLFNIEALGDRIGYLKEFLKDDILWDISVRPNIPTTTYSNISEESIADFDSVMSLFADVEEQPIDDYGVYNWVKDTSNYYATANNIKFDVSNKDGEVGGEIVVKNGKAKVDGDVSAASTKFIINTFVLILITLIVLF